MKPRSKCKGKAGGDSCPEYVPVADELHALSKYWAWVLVDTQLEFFRNGVADPREEYASTRLALIMDLIGANAVDEAFTAVRRERLRGGWKEQRGVSLKVGRRSDN